MAKRKLTPNVRPGFRRAPKPMPQFPKGQDGPKPKGPVSSIGIGGATDSTNIALGWQSGETPKPTISRSDVMSNANAGKRGKR